MELNKEDKINILKGQGKDHEASPLNKELRNN